MALNDYNQFKILREGGTSWHTEEDVEPLLRRLSSLTEEERREWSFTGSERRFFEEVSAEQTAYLLSKHFDLFGLIDSGQAIDEATLKVKI